MCCAKPLPDDSPIRALLEGCEFLDLLVGEDDITLDKDYKHVIKRLRNTVLRNKGICVCGVWITPTVIGQHLRDSGLSASHVHSMFKPSDRQDVPLAYNLLRDLWSIPAATPDQIRPSYVETREAIRTYGQLCYHLVYPYICVDLSLSEQLEHLSAAAHLALSLYDVNHENGSAADALMPTTLYLDIMHMVKNAFICVAKAQIDLPLSEFFLILLGTDRLETLFGILRTMVGNDANLDLLQLALRMTGTTKIANILAKYPQWDKGPRRLHLPLITRDSTSLPDVIDHINPRIWRGCVLVALVTLVTCWKLGRRHAAERCSFVEPALKRLRSYPNATILAPYGIPLFKIPLAEEDREEDDGDEFSASLSNNATSHDSGVLDGLRELEDAAMEAEWGNSASPRTFSRTIDIDGKPVNKARALALRFKYQKTTSSADRLRRVAQEGRYPSASTFTYMDNEPSEGPFLSIFDPVASLLVCEQKLFLCIGEVNGVSVDSHATERVSLQLLPESTVKITFQVLRLVPASTDDDPSEKNDWRSSRPLPTHRFTAPGFLVRPLNPTASISSDTGTPYLLFDSDSLRILTSALRDSLTRPQLRLVPKAKMCRDFPYREASGKYRSVHFTPQSN